MSVPATSFDLTQLDTLLAVVDEGTFEAAARRLRITASAVSQRIRALENTAGQVVVRRAAPCTATPAAEPLVRIARQFRLLTQEGQLGAEEAAVELPIVVNADSLRTWFAAVLTEAAGWAATSLRITVEDERRSHELLRRGDVLAAVTSDPQPLPGCSIERVGAMRYRAAATRVLVERHRCGRGIAWAAMPVVVFNEHDRLHELVLDARGEPRPTTVHQVPSSADLHGAVRAGLGWAMLPDQQLDPDLEDGQLVLLPGTRAVQVSLYWQRWALESAALRRLTDAVHNASEASLPRVARRSDDQQAHHAAPRP